MSNNKFYAFESQNIYKSTEYEVLNKKNNYASFLNRQLNNPIEYYEVLTDGDQLWILIDDLIKICSQIRYEQLICFNFKEDNNVVHGKKYIAVTQDFLKFIKENTLNPKYIPYLCKLKVMERINNEVEVSSKNADDILITR